MAIPFIGPIINGIVSLIKSPVEGYVERKKVETTAKAKRQQSRLDHASEWELKALDDDSWTRDWLVLLISIPMVLCFFPYTVDPVMRGFEVLETTPDWYQYLIGSVFAFAFGRREINNIMTKRTATKVATAEQAVRQEKELSMADITSNIRKGMMKP